MAKIAFDIKYRPQIESGEYKIEIGKSDPWPARIVCWDLNGNDLIIIVTNPDGKEEGLIYTPEGKHKAYAPRIDSDLFIITSEKELTEFEIRLLDWLSSDTSGEIPMERMKEVVRNRASELLSLACDQFIKDGYLVEKKAFHNTAENISNKHQAEMSIQYSTHCKIEDGTRHAIMNWDTFQKVAQKFIDIGKADAMKDLPRWEKIPFSGTYVNTFEDGSKFLFHDGYCLGIKDLEKLPVDLEED